MRNVTGRGTVPTSVILYLFVFCIAHYLIDGPSGLDFDASVLPQVALVDSQELDPSEATCVLVSSAHQDQHCPGHQNLHDNKGGVVRASFSVGPLTLFLPVYAISRPPPVA